MAIHRPYKQYAESGDGMRKLVMTAVVAWNTALMPEAEQVESLQKVAQALTCRGGGRFHGYRPGNG